VSDEPRVPSGRGREHTFQQDLTDPEDVRRRVAETARETARDVAGEGRSVARVVVKVRFAPFFTATHQATLPEPSSDPAAIEEAALRALERFELGRPVRLIGVRVEFAREADPG
jgi:DNA polymerase-4